MQVNHAIDAHFRLVTQYLKVALPVSFSSRSLSSEVLNFCLFWWDPV